MNCPLLGSRYTFMPKSLIFKENILSAHILAPHLAHPLQRCFFKGWSTPMASINSISSFYSYSQYCLTLLYPSFSVLLSPLIFLDQLLLSSLLTQVRSNSKVTLERVSPSPSTQSGALLRSEGPVLFLVILLLYYYCGFSQRLPHNTALQKAEIVSFASDFLESEARESTL